MGKIHIELKKLVYNTGQIEGVPRNPRKWTKEDVTALAASIVETPELFEARPLLVVPRGDRFIVIGGNMRLAAARELAMAMPPCYEIQDRSVDNLKRMALKDNASFGEWDAVALADEWPDCPLADWGIVLPPAPVEEQGDGNSMEADEIERKKREFEERMRAGEIDEGDEEYQAFLEKFVPKKTTDDCYTPELVYDAVAKWVAEEYHVAPRHFVRPFYPGGDYQAFDYLPDAIVVDNPPFSILSEIIRFYMKRGIRFFLFGPTLTLFSSSSSSLVTAIPTAATVVYENGASVNTSFITNLEDPSIRLRSAPTLYRAVTAAVEETLRAKRVELPKYAYPDNVVTSAFVARLSRYGIDFSVSRAESVSIDALDAQKEQGRAIYGKGYLVSERAAAERAAAERAAVERAAAIRFALSPREMEIVRSLGKENPENSTQNPENSTQNA